MSVGGGGAVGLGGPRTGNSSGKFPGNSSGLCGSPGSRTGGGISGRGFPGGLSSGGGVGCPGGIGGSSRGSIGIARLLGRTSKLNEPGATMFLELFRARRRSFAFENPDGRNAGSTDQKARARKVDDHLACARVVPSNGNML